MRTSRFKEWFGDWLRAIMEVPIISASKEHGFINFKEARKWAKDNLVGDYNNPEIGSVHISGLAIDKYLSAPAVTKSINKDIHLSTLRVLPRILENSFIGEIHEDRDYDANIKDIVRLFGCVNINGVSYRVKTTVKRYNDNGAKSKAYSYEVTEIELLDGSGIPHTQSADFIPTSNNSITLAKLLKGVKKNNSSEDILSVSQIVDANGEPKVVYNGSKVQHYQYDGRLRAKGQSATNSKVSFFTDSKSVAEKYSNHVNAVFLNIRNPYEITKIELKDGKTVTDFSNNPSSNNSITFAKLVQNVENDKKNGEKLLNSSKVIDANCGRQRSNSATNKTLIDSNLVQGRD